MPMLNAAEQLQQQLINNGYDYPEQIQQRFLTYLELLNRWNQKHNLTAIRNISDMITHHILDSLSILSYIKGERVIDIGSGAGLPGIILAITQPDRSFFLLDANGKKTRFLIQVVLELELKNVTVIHERAEKYFPVKCFDQVVTRAFSSLSEMLQLTQHLICPQGEFLAMKGIYPRDEIKEISNEFAVNVQELKIKGLNESRCLVIIKTNA